jgi:stringent starvation protein B
MKTRPITTDARPHFIPGVYTWLSENFSKIHVVAIINHPRFACSATLPTREILLPIAGVSDFENKGCIFDVATLNIGVDAVGRLSMDEEGIFFNTRFNQVVTEVYIPFESVVSIHAPENVTMHPFSFSLMPGQEKYSKGAIKETPSSEATVVVTESPAPPPRRTDHLKLVKG